MYQTETKLEKLKLLLKILVPILIYQFANFSAKFIDTIMTGNYSSKHLAGVAIAVSLWAPFFALVTGIVTALVPMVGQLLGSKKEKAVESVVIQFVYVGIVLALVLIGVGSITLQPILNMMNLEQVVHEVASNYLRLLSIGLIPLLICSVLRSFIDALGYTNLSMALMLLLVPLNIFFNYSFIYGTNYFPELGGAGAGLGTAISYWVLLIVSLIGLKFHPKLKQYHLFKLEKIDWSVWHEIFVIGLPLGFAIFVEYAVFALVGLIMAKFGSTVIASHQAAMNFCDLAYAFPMSISSGLTIIVAYEVGAKNHESAHQYTKEALGLAVGIACVTLFLVKQNSYWVANLYGTDPEFIRRTMSFLTYGLLFQLLDAIAAPLQGALRGYKDTKIPFLLCITGFWLIGLPIGFLLDYLTQLGPYAYWIGCIVGMASNCLFMILRYLVIYKKYRMS